ncbi:MAG: Replication initiator protein [Planctomycetota bacterium]|nr:Replication initiator protein [Planctomycetota bacterium]
MNLDLETLEIMGASPTNPVEIIRLGKDEMNLAEFPITLLTDRVPKGKKILKYQDRIFDEKSGKQITRTLTISADEAHGLPTAVDDDVILGLIQLTKLVNNFTSREVEFSRLDLIRQLGWPDSGDSYRRLATSLKRWLSVTLLYENAWRDNRKGAWITKGFHILDNIELNDTRTTNEQGELFPSKIIWNKVVFESFEAGYLKTIDYGLYIKLRHTIARRMYRFLSKRMYFGPDLTFDLRDLAFAHIGLSDSYSGNAGKIKEKLQPALEELESVGFLDPMGKEDRYQKDGKDWKIRLVARPGKSSALPDSGDVAPAIPGDPPLVTELVLRKVTRTVALELAQRHPSELITAKIEVFDWLSARQDRRVAKSPAGYLVKSITDNYANPKGFTSEAERRQRQEAMEVRERGEAEARGRKQGEDARERAKKRRDTAYWESLSSEQKADLDAASKAQADPESLAMEEKGDGSLRRIGQALRRNAYIRQMLDSQ